MSERIVAVPNLDAALDEHIARGYRLDMIMPADAPRTALISRGGERLRLVAPHQSPPETDTQAFVITRASGEAWSAGRAGMQYRDLIPGRCGGRFIASHIRIERGGPVADYVHHHAIRFQMIYCRRGWVRVVYEDQGPPFVMHEGDCVLQPPMIRHRVLESSPGLEVIEIASPAEHETWRDHDLDLPTATIDPNRLYAGQRFVRHVAADARAAIRDTHIATATNGLANARVLTLANGATHSRRHTGEFLFFALLKGRLSLDAEAHGTHSLETDDACVLPTGTAFAIRAVEQAEILEVELPLTRA
jgi:mannose-6-phosphate isomerase-like protein (cupin superfamily)